MVRRSRRIGARRSLKAEPQTDKPSGGGEADEPAAVALRYDPPREDAPRIVAKGRGEVAAQILEIALAKGIAIREDADLVALLDAVELDMEIPLEAFIAVAEILAYLYRANGRQPPGPDGTGGRR